VLELSKEEKKAKVAKEKLIVGPLSTYARILSTSFLLYLGIFDGSPLEL
jgi:hypothetical protein